MFIFLKSELMSLTQYWRFFLGVTLALIVILFPRGVMGVAQDYGRCERNRMSATYSECGRTLIETVGVSKAYGSFVALDSVSLAVARGELLSIVGPNGAGKTTLVNVLTGLLKPTSGTVRFKGDDIAGIGPVALAKRGMARAFQLVHIFPAMTVAQTIGVAVVSQSSKSLRLFASVATDAGLAFARA